MLAFNKVEDAASTNRTLQALAPVAIGGYMRNAGPVSQNVVLWEPSRTVTQQRPLPRRVTADAGPAKGLEDRAERERVVGDQTVHQP
jgi:hypothetical protein